MKKFPFHVVLFSLFPLLSLYDHNKDLLEFSFAIKAVISVAILSISVFFISSAFLKKTRKSGVLSSLVILTFFSFGHILTYVYKFGTKTFPPLLNYNQFIITCNIITAILTLSFLVIVFIKTKKSNKSFEILTFYLNIFSMLLIAYLLVSISFYEFKNHSNPSLAIEKNKTSKVALADIYYIILDGYGRGDVLKDVYDFDNSSFTKELEKRDFYVAKKSRTNYSQTYLSLSSSLNYEYLDALSEEKNKESSNRGTYKEKIKNNKIFSFLRNRGYHIAATPTPWSGIQGNTKTDIVFETDSLNEFEEMLLNLTPLCLYFNNEKLAEDHKNSILLAFKSLNKIPSLTYPTFTLSHIYSPHPPFVFNENGEAIKSRGGFWKGDGDFFIKGNPNKPTTADYKKEYIAQLRFISTKTLQSIDQIIANSPTPPVIILQSDHGPGSMLDWESEEKTNMHERMSILNAYYLPEKGRDMLYETITPVNSFRVVLNSLFDANLDLLEDRSYFAKWSRPYDFIDVTAETLRE